MSPVGSLASARAIGSYRRVSGQATWMSPKRTITVGCTAASVLQHPSSPEATCHQATSAEMPGCQRALGRRLAGLATGRLPSRMLRPALPPLRLATL